MKATVIHDAGDLLVVNTVLTYGAMGGRNIHEPYRQSLTEMSGKTYEVSTAYLFGDNVSVIVPGHEHVVSLSHVYITAIEADEREKPTYQAVDYIQCFYPDLTTRIPEIAFRIPKRASYQMTGRFEATFIRDPTTAWWDKLDWSALETIVRKRVHIPFNDEDVDWKIILQTLYGHRHHCRPIRPLLPRHHHWHFNSKGKYSAAWFNETFPEYRHG